MLFVKGEGRGGGNRSGMAIPDRGRKDTKMRARDGGTATACIAQTGRRPLICIHSKSSHRDYKLLNSRTCPREVRTHLPELILQFRRLFQCIKKNSPAEGTVYKAMHTLNFICHCINRTMKSSLASRENYFGMVEEGRIRFEPFQFKIFRPLFKSCRGQQSFPQAFLETIKTAGEMEGRGRRRRRRWGAGRGFVTFLFR